MWTMLMDYVPICVQVRDKINGVGESTYYYGPHEFCIIAARPQNQIILS